MRILVFLHDTTIMHRSGLGVSRRERVAQGRQKDPSVRDYASYVPIGLAATKLHRWERQGAKVIYLSSHTSWDDVQKDFAVLRKHDFPLADIAYRCGNKQYGDVADELGPDLVVEDDCESIGGEIGRAHV